jgi:hypothetical protein
MKRIITSVFTIFVAAIVYGQTDNSDIDIVQAIFGKNKRIIISEYLQLADDQQNSFWKLYDQYEEKRKSIERQRFMILKDYADNYLQLDAEKAERLITQFMKTDGQYNTLHQTYYKKMAKITGTLKAATFIQLETFIQTALQSNLQSQIPVIGELQRQDNKNGINKIRE